MFRDTKAEVSLDAIRGNMASIRQALPDGVKLMAVVKADGYGHGAVAAARMAERGGANLLGVAYLNEALELRANGVKLPILILTPIDPAEVLFAVRHELMITVTCAQWFRELGERRVSFGGARLKVHVKVDTGLGRIGLRTRQEWEELAPWLLADDIVVEGLYTHFATAGKDDTAFLKQQYECFLESIAWCRESGIGAKHYHCAGSIAALRFPKELAMDMVRIGAAMFGFYPDSLPCPVELRPALSLKSSLIQVKLLRKGESVGYDNCYVADEDQWIGTVPIGYADGWSQSLRGSEMLVAGRRVPIAGKICMDQLMVRLPGPVRIGAEVMLIGKQGEEYIGCSELAAHLGSVPQEVSTALSGRVERIYTDAEEGALWKDGWNAAQ